MTEHNSDLLKRKTMMVLFKFEEALGDFVKDNISIDQLGAPEENSLRIKDELERSYLEDVFQMAKLATKGTSAEAYVADLYSAAHTYELFQIRNTIAHPNRHFFDCYWYRVAAMGSHPAIEKLGIRSVKSAIWSAEQGTIEDPPEGWEEKYVWEIPNNLPNYTEYDITGLVGRERDKDEIKKRLSNPRVHSLAIIAPGGIGKTALAIDVLRDLVSSPEATSWLDGIVFLTLKTEELSTTGISKLENPEMAAGLRSSIGANIGDVFSENFENIDQAVDKLSAKNLLICIDNLESLLRDKPEVFDRLADTLPPNWKLLVTSRVSVSNAAIFTLEPLRISSAIHLARIYVRSRGGNDLTEKEYKDVAESCYFNPLAIRLTLDFVIAGHKLPDSLKTAKSGIAEYSYKNLIDILTDTAMRILELIFSRPDIERNSICEMLGISADEAAESLLVLSNTSLINRSVVDQVHEGWVVNDSVNDLLVINPRNLSIREEVQSLLKKKSIAVREIDREQLKNRVPTWHENYIDPSLDNGLKLLLGELRKAISEIRRDKKFATDLYGKFSSSEEVFGESAEFHRGFGRLLGLLKLPSKAEQHYEQALQIEPDDDRIKYCYCRLLFEYGKFPECESLYKKIIDKFDFSELGSLDSSFVDTVYQGYYLSLLSTGDYERILVETKEWKESGYARRAQGIFRAGALKRKMEKLVGRDNAAAFELLRRAFVIIDDVLGADGYSEMACRQAFKLVSEFKYLVFEKEITKLDQAKLIWVVSWIDRHLTSIVSYGKIPELDVEPIVTTLSLLSISDNPFSERVYWKSFMSPLITKGIELDEIPSNATLVHIVAIMKNKFGHRSNFLFAKDQNNNDYFVHFSNFVTDDWNEWQKLRETYPLVVYSHRTQEGKSSLYAESINFVNT